ncbi:SH3 domain-containing protein [Methyloraptor flagellatus]|uniref:SH3 domain-containing protein n=1 Tax=Methyloraptor flagellatus TaxID=3162530 RepID=A0AAU7XA23_9HYPH
MLNALARYALIAMLAVGSGASPASAQGIQRGPSGYPLPRFASIKSFPVNVRQGPSRDHDVAWTFMRAGVPVEITQEYDIWFRIRDSEGQEGWVQKTLLSGRRTALITPWEKGPNAPVRDKPDQAARVTAYLEPMVLVDVAECNGTWCRIAVEGIKGWIDQTKVWGVYPGEKVE